MSYVISRLSVDDSKHFNCQIAQFGITCNVFLKPRPHWRLSFLATGPIVAW